jgi:hypothetical protein
MTPGPQQQDAQPEPERGKSAAVIYLCPECVGTLTAHGLTWQCSQPHTEREHAFAQEQEDQDLRKRIHLLLQQGKTRSELLVLIWQQPSPSRRARTLRLLRETDGSRNI